MAIARWVLPRPGLPARISDRPSVTKSGESAEPSIVQPQRRLVGEVEIVDRLQKRKVRAARQPREARLLPMRDFLGDQEREEVAIGPGLPLGALRRDRATRAAHSRDAAV